MDKSESTVKRTVSTVTSKPKGTKRASKSSKTAATISVSRSIGESSVHKKHRKNPSLALTIKKKKPKVLASYPCRRDTRPTWAQPLTKSIVDKNKIEEPKRNKNSRASKPKKEAIGYKPRLHNRHAHQQRRQVEFERYMEGRSIHDDEEDNPYAHILN